MTKTTMGMKILVACVVLTSLVLQESNACDTELYNVQLQNDLPSNDPPLTVHCSGKGKDQGTTTVGMSTVYSLSVCENLFKRTIYYCDFNWGSKHQGFNIYDSKNSYYYCTNKLCSWSAREDGLYFKENTESMVKKYDWN